MRETREKESTLRVRKKGKGDKIIEEETSPHGTREAAMDRYFICSMDQKAFYKMQ